MARYCQWYTSVVDEAFLTLEIVEMLEEAIINGGKVWGMRWTRQSFEAHLVQFLHSLCGVVSGDRSSHNVLGFYELCVRFLTNKLFHQEASVETVNIIIFLICFRNVFLWN